MDKDRLKKIAEREARHRLREERARLHLKDAQRTAQQYGAKVKG
jgi:hypothetical protein